MTVIFTSESDSHDVFSKSHISDIVHFQKISIPTLRKVNRNSKGEGVSKAQFFKGKYMDDTKMKFLEGYGYFLEQHISMCRSCFSPIKLQDQLGYCTPLEVSHIQTM